MDSSPLLTSQDVISSERSSGAPAVQRASHKSQAAKSTESLDFHQIHNEIQCKRDAQINWYTERSAIG